MIWISFVFVLIFPFYLIWWSRLTPFTFSIPLLLLHFLLSSSSFLLFLNLFILLSLSLSSYPSSLISLSFPFSPVSCFYALSLILPLSSRPPSPSSFHPSPYLAVSQLLYWHGFLSQTVLPKRCATCVCLFTIQQTALSTFKPNMQHVMPLNNMFILLYLYLFLCPLLQRSIL